MFKYIKFDLFIKCNYSEVAWKVPEQKPKTENWPDLSHLSPEDREKVEILQKESENIKWSLKFLNKYITWLNFWLDKISKTENPNDREFQQFETRIKARLSNLWVEYQVFSWKQTDIKAQLDKITWIQKDIRNEIENFENKSWVDINAQTWEIKKMTLDKDKLKTINNKEFLSVSASERLQYITKENIDADRVASWEIKGLEFSFTFDWQFNRELYLKTTAWQVLPKEVRDVKIWDEIYSRKWLWGEFFTSNNERLIIQEWTKIEIWDLRTHDQINEISNSNNKITEEYLKNNPEANKNIVSEAISRWIDPKFAILAFWDLVKDLPPEQAKVVLEDTFTEFDRMRWQVEASTELQDWKYDENLTIWLLQKFSPDNWKNKALNYGFNQEKIDNFVNVSNTKIDFSSIENWDMKAMIDKTAEELWVQPKMIQSILKQESSWNMSATRFEKHVYDRKIREWNSPWDAKLLATSFWWFQIMWFNYKTCWYDSVQSYVEAMKSPEKQFQAFTDFVKSNHKLHQAMKWDNPNFPTIAYNYNGPNYAQNNYDTELEKKFRSV